MRSDILRRMVKDLRGQQFSIFNKTALMDKVFKLLDAMLNDLDDTDRRLRAVENVIAAAVTAKPKPK